MKTSIPALLCGLLVAAVWGYFSDLQDGQVGWFIGRLALVSIALVAAWRVFAAKTVAALAAETPGGGAAKLGPTAPTKSS